MALKPIEVSGGESYYCINEAQLKKAYELAQSNTNSSSRIQMFLERISGGLDRNEQAALAFVLIDQLLNSK